MYKFVLLTDLKTSSVVSQKAKLFIKIIKIIENVV